jgi:hypothetical protein
MALTSNLLRTLQAAAWLKDHGVHRTPGTLARMRCKGDGPAFRRFGNAVFYSIEDMEKWIDEKLSPPVYSTREFRDHTTQTHERRPGQGGARISKDHHQGQQDHVDMLPPRKMQGTRDRDHRDRRPPG